MFSGVFLCERAGPAGGAPAAHHKAGGRRIHFSWPTRAQQASGALLRNAPPTRRVAPLDWLALAGLMAGGREGRGRAERRLREPSSPAAAGQRAAHLAKRRPTLCAAATR